MRTAWVLTARILSLGGKLYVMNSGEGDVAVIDLKSMAVVARHKVGVNPFGGGLRLTNGR